jgi:hypothetical protein
MRCIGGRVIGALIQWIGSCASQPDAPNKEGGHGVLPSMEGVLGYDRKQRVAMAKKGLAIPITNDSGEILDGSCPIATRDDLALAIKNFSKATDKRAAKRHITKRAAALGADDLLPHGWGTETPRRRRGRPVGSVSLTREREDRLLGFIRKGIFDHVAADYVDISERTLREWVARGEGRSSRPATPKLRDFARKYRQAKAEVRAVAEARIYQQDLKYWLSHAAPSRPGLPGWTKMPEGSDEGDGPSPEELKDLITGVRNDLLYTNPNALVPECLNRRCRCSFHRPRTPQELERLRGIAAKRRQDPGATR